MLTEVVALRQRLEWLQEGVRLLLLATYGPNPHARVREEEDRALPGYDAIRKLENAWGTPGDGEIGLMLMEINNQVHAQLTTDLRAAEYQAISAMRPKETE